METEMKYRELGSSGIKASIVGLGTFAIGGWFWGGTDEKKSIEAIHASLDNGINLIDTAPIYGYGLSEEIVGKALKGKREKAVIATKAGMVWNKEKGVFHAHADDKGPTGEPSKYKIYQYLHPDSIMEEIEMSLKRLGTDYIDLYQTHWQDSTTPIADTMEALLKLKDQGKIRAIGVSNVTVDQLEEYRKHGEIVSAQEKYSLLDRAAAEKGIADYCADNNIAILSYFTMEQGLLTGKLSPNREFSDGDTRKSNPNFTPENRKRVIDVLQKVTPIAQKHNATIAQVIIALTAAQRGITHVLIGARNSSQATENAEGGYIDLSQGEIEELNAVIDGLR